MPLLLSRGGNSSAVRRTRTCQVMHSMAIVQSLIAVTNPHVSHTSSPIAVIISLINVVVPVVAISYAP